MRAWFENIAGPQYATGLMWTIAALILLVILLVLARIIRNLTAGTFVAGGRNRRTRLAVMDAAAVDNQRRLVLVRRDDVEHLILIGGPTDVVVEQNIVPAGTRERNHRAAEEPVITEPRTQAPPRKPERQPAPEPVVSAEPVQAQKPEPVVPMPPAPSPAPKQSAEPAAFHNIAPARPERNAPRPGNTLAPAEPAPQAEAGSAGNAGAEQEFHPAPVVQPAAQPTPQEQPAAAPQAPVNDIDRALAKEIETAAAAPAPQSKERPNSLEDEMSRLLGELSRERG